MLKGIWLKVAAFFAALSGILLVWGRRQQSQREKAEHEVKIKDTIEEIDAEQELFEQELRKDEQKRINQKVKNSQFASRRDRASKL
jgi:uncharacterized protein with von Willebrand factor type A (vWA) domain